MIKLGLELAIILHTYSHTIIIIIITSTSNLQPSMVIANQLPYSLNITRGNIFEVEPDFLKKEFFVVIFSQIRTKRL